MPSFPERIPRKVHYCWLSGDPMPALQKRCLASWRRHLPDYELVCWDRERFDVESVPFVREAVENRKWAFAADYIRLHALVTEGGIYLDSDVEVFSSFDPFLHHRAFSGVELWAEIPKPDIEGAVLGAEAGHPWIAACLEHYRDRPFVRGDGSFDQTIVSGVIGEAAARFGFAHEPVKQDLDEGLCIYPPVVFTHARGEFSRAETVALHHCLGSWRDRSPVKQAWQHVRAWFRRC
ncbi:glycosyltransferase family 32 protein [Haloferula sargassicola]|uniref:Glycosyl transferase n=1 Tax=Haloferula sargassicola TaxID=490096 RepID=A0ABP9URB1_9BACT